MDEKLRQLVGVGDGGGNFSAVFLAAQSFERQLGEKRLTQTPKPLLRACFGQNLTQPLDDTQSRNATIVPS